MARWTRLVDLSVGILAIFVGLTAFVKGENCNRRARRLRNRQIDESIVKPLGTVFLRDSKSCLMYCCFYAENGCTAVTFFYKGSFKCVMFKCETIEACPTKRGRGSTSIYPKMPPTTTTSTTILQSTLTTKLLMMTTVSEKPTSPETTYALTTNVSNSGTTETILNTTIVTSTASPVTTKMRKVVTEFTAAGETSLPKATATTKPQLHLITATATRSTPMATITLEWTTKTNASTTTTNKATSSNVPPQHRKTNIQDSSTITTANVTTPTEATTTKTTASGRLATMLPQLTTTKVASTTTATTTANKGLSASQATTTNTIQHKPLYLTNTIHRLTRTTNTTHRLTRTTATNRERFQRLLAKTTTLKTETVIAAPATLRPASATQPTTKTEPRATTDVLSRKTTRTEPPADPKMSLLRQLFQFSGHDLVRIKTELDRIIIMHKMRKNHLLNNS